MIQFSPERLQAGGGSGYGLCIAQGIIGIHDGYIGVYSPGEGKGSTFVVEIPMQRNPQITVSRDMDDDGNDDTIASLTVTANNTNNTNNTSNINATSRTKKVTIDDHASFVQPRNRSTMEVLQQVRRDSSGSSSSRGGHSGDDVSDHLSAKQKSRATSTLRSASTPSSPDSDQSPPSALNSNGLHLLIVDDDDKNRKMMVRYFQRVGYRCDEADNGLRAIEKVEQMVDNRWNDPEAGYSVIMMDFVMPFMDGPTATKILREKGYMGCIFGLTGNVAHKDKEYFLKRGLDKVFTKPLDTTEFEATMLVGDPYTKSDPYDVL